MNMKNVGIAAKYTMITLAGCAAVAVAAESLSAGGKKDVPVLTASDSTTSSPEQSVTSTPPTPSSSYSTTVSSSAPLSTSTQSSTSVSPPATSEPPEPPVSVNEPPEDIPDFPDPQSVPTESTSEQPPASTSSKSFWELSDEELEKYLQNALGIIQPSAPILSSSTSTVSSTPPTSINEPSISSNKEPPTQSSEPSIIDPPESVSPNYPEFVIVNINTATVDELIQLDGIGEEKALAIIEFREKFGGFTSIYEIREVDGIGDSTFEQIRDFIVI